MAIINGTAANDIISGTTLDDVIDGGAGNDRINGGTGNDIIYGGLGSDTLTGDAGNDTLYGGDGNDGFFGGGGSDILYGEAGDDVMYGDGGDDILIGGDGNDKLYGGTGNDTLDGGAGINIVDGGAGIDTIVINLAAADITTALRADMATLKSFMDTQLANAGSLTALSTQTTGAALNLASLGLTISNFETAKIFVDGVETPITAFLNQAPAAAATVALSTSEDTPVTGQVVATDADGDTLSFALDQGPAHGALALDAATGAYTYTAAANYSGSDTFSIKVSDGKGGFTIQQVNVAIGAVADAATLTAAAAFIAAGQTITGTSANDTLTGTAGNDTISGGAGNDTIYGDGPAAAVTTDLNIAAALTDTDGSESLAIRISGMPSGATLSAGIANPDGSWTLTAAQLAGLKLTTTALADFDLTVTATSTEATGGSATTTANLHVTVSGGANDDVIDGGAGNDTIYGGLGNDTLTGGDGNDTLFGGDGNDTVIVGNKLGNDKYDGGAGFDTLDFSTSSIAVTVDLTAGTYKGWSSGTVTGFESVIGSAKADWIKGTQSDSVIDGGAGNDIINGGAGNDTLYGGANDDQVYGGANNDKIYGGDGNDYLDGGSGNDIIYDGAGNDIVKGGDGNDYIFAGSGLDTYIGGAGFDTLDYSGATGPLTIDAGLKTITGFTSDTMNGIEKIVGSNFDDNFIGGKDSNVFDGGAGNDTFRGMGGADTFTGGAGNDTYNWYVKDVKSGGSYLGADAITDFSTGDKLNLHEFVKSFPGAPIDSIVKLTDSAAGTMVSVKIGTTFLDLVQLQGVHETSASTLLANGQILT